MDKLFAVLTIPNIVTWLKLQGQLMLVTFHLDSLRACTINNDTL